jgi:hypothetical protein
VVAVSCHAGGWASSSANVAASQAPRKASPAASTTARSRRKPALEEQDDDDGDGNGDSGDLGDADQRRADGIGERGDALEHARLECRHAVTKRDGKDVPGDQEQRRPNQPHDIRRAADASRSGQVLDDRSRSDRRATRLGRCRSQRGR